MLTGKSMAMVNTYYSISIKVPVDNAFKLGCLLIERGGGGSIIFFFFRDGVAR